MKRTLLYFILFIFSVSIQAQVFSENFDGETLDATTFSNWSSLDEDGDDEFWEVFNADANLVDLDDDGTNDVQMNWNLSGLAADSDSWEGGSALTPDNYLITSNPIDLTNVTGTTISYTVGTYQTNPNFIGDQYSVYLTTSNDLAEIANATPITTRQLSDDFTAAAPDGSESYADITLDASAYDGQIVYLTFRHYNSTDQNSVLLDNIVVDGVLGVEDKLFNNFSYYANQNYLELSASSPINEIKIYSILGNEIKKVNSNSLTESVNITELASGIYLAQINIRNQSKTFKFLKK
ncbi:T9SS type A sorting domain-containing protein [Mesonia sp.]|uniref:T9SS-dependent choice-of-anchor J family protein n=1 Tax=Mesonia sp. TaxID=1960830 RepID=UPI0017690639|nr:T9SS type A sorting domain-containing protein [Mesonia sp.]HIB37641.1 T9SS type A sorting domain-containing protein [Mesonia sp.]HIO26890.1 T9SS type A sorting domain-containing protein [Flavobacteriaceae bacterium]